MPKIESLLGQLVIATLWGSIGAHWGHPGVWVLVGILLAVCQITLSFIREDWAK